MVGLYLISPCPIVAIHSSPRVSALMSKILIRDARLSSTLLYLYVSGSIYPSPRTYAPAHILPSLSSARAMIVLGMSLMWTMRLWLESSTYIPSLSVPTHERPLLSISVLVTQQSPIWFLLPNFVPEYPKPMGFSGCMKTPFCSIPNHIFPELSSANEYTFER